MYAVILYPDIESALLNELKDEIKKSGNNLNYNDFKKLITKLGEFGLTMNDNFKRNSFKRLEDNLYELRSPNLRIFFTAKDSTFYLLNGFVKKSKKTPQREIEKARIYVNKIHNNK